MIQSLREKHGQDFENWWRQTFGFGYDSLTRSEARYLVNSVMTLCFHVLPWANTDCNGRLPNYL